MRRLCFSICILFFLAHPASAHVVSFSQNALSLTTNEVSFVDLTLDTEGRFVNALELYVTYDATHLEVLDIITADSVVDLWVSPPRAEDGRLSFIGGISGGAVIKHGTIATLVLKGSRDGSSTMQVDIKTSGVYANDGLGTRESLAASDAQISFSAASPDAINVQSPTHPEQNTWYNNTTVRLVWEIAADDVISYTWSKEYTENPDNAAEEYATETEFQNVEDGIWYFSIKKQITNSAWTDVTRRRVLLDATPPADFTAELLHDAEEFNGESVLIFSTEDATSGIARYDVIEDETVYADVTSPYVIQNTKAASYTVRAFDRSGNESFSTILFAEGAQSSPTVFYVIVALIILFSAIIVFRILYTPKDERRDTL